MDADALGQLNSLERAQDAIRDWAIIYLEASMALRRILRPQPRYIRVVLLDELSGDYNESKP